MSSRYHRLLAIVPTFVLALTLARVATGQSYQLTDLGTLGGTYSLGNTLNERGDVAGVAATGSNTVSAFLYSDGSMYQLGSLGGSSSYGYGLNDTGQLTGVAYTAGDAATHAFLYQDGLFTDLVGLGGSSSAGYAINDSGQVTGYARLSGDIASRAFIYSDGLMDELGTLGGKHSVGYGINRGGDVTGAASTGYRDAMHAFWYDYNYGSLTDLGTLGGSSRQITGAANIVGDMAAHAFLYSAGVMRDIGTLGGSFSVGFSINTAGVVTGASSIAGNAGSHAFLYVNEAMLDLNQLLDPSEVLSTTVTLTRATDINDAGQIVADGLDRNTGQTHAYLLTPRSALGRSASDSGIATVSWSASTTNTDGSPLTNLAGYRIYYGKSINSLTQMAQVPNAARTQFVLNNLSAGIWYFAVAAYTTSGMQSDYSEIVFKAL
jgi:probable HAF family extracellular repeat protein